MHNRHRPARFGLCIKGDLAFAVGKRPDIRLDMGRPESGRHGRGKPATAANHGDLRQLAAAGRGTLKF